MSLPGFDLHGLKGHNPARTTVHVDGPWYITFEFRDGDAHVLTSSNITSVLNLTQSSH
jgi:proteic killer suppression protein